MTNLNFRMNLSGLKKRMNLKFRGQNYWLFSFFFVNSLFKMIVKEKNISLLKFVS